jgi:hypothetical protein
MEFKVRGLFIVSKRMKENEIIYARGEMGRG